MQQFSLSKACDRQKREGFLIINPLMGKVDYNVEEFEGVLPDDLVQILYRNGLVKFGINRNWVAYTFNANALVLRLQFCNPNRAEC